MINSKNKFPKYISGPVSFFQYKIKDFDLFLFGDKHHGLENMCTNCNYIDKNTKKIVKNSEDCYTLSAWIKHLSEKLKNTKKYIDLYVEDDFSLIGNENNSNNYIFDGRLSELSIFHNCKNCNLRYHLVDFRSFEKKNLQSGFVLGALGDVYNSIQKLIDYEYNVNDDIKYKEQKEYEGNDQYDDDEDEYDEDGDDEDEEDEHDEEDIEQEDDEYLYNATVILKNFLILKDATLRDYAMLCAKSKNYELDIKTFFTKCKINFKKLDRNYLSNAYLEFLNKLCQTGNMTKKYKGMTLHHIGKQFRKLMEQENYSGNKNDRIEEMVNFITNMDPFEIKPDFDSDFLTIFQKIKKAIITHNKFRKDFYDDELYDLLVSYSIVVYPMDIYAIPRILYNYEDSQLKIYSAGYVHIDICKKFLDKFYINSLIDSINKIEENDRCLQIGL